MTPDCKLELVNQRDMIRYLFNHWDKFPAQDWNVQGFGFMRLRINPSLRLHIWDSSLRIPDVSDIHDHAQWAFVSYVVSGYIINTRYQEQDGVTSAVHNMATINCGIGGGLVAGSERLVSLTTKPQEMYMVGDSYSQEPDEIHRTTASEGTITLLRQYRRPTGTARVIWPVGTSWVDAIPRVATPDEIKSVIGRAFQAMG